MFIRLCSTSKCNYFTYNTSLYTREREKEGKKEAVQLVRGKKKEERDRTLKEVIAEREIISHNRHSSMIYIDLPTVAQYIQFVLS